MKKEKKVLILSVIGVFLIGIVISFAYWQVLLQQESVNVVNSECFKVTFQSNNAIHLSNIYPVSDEEGFKSIPYTFKITNQCESYAKYQLNLETILHNNKILPEKYLKINLSEKEKELITSKLINELEVEPTLENASKAYLLNMGVLKPKEEKEYQLKIWMHSEVTASNLDSMNAMFQGKISVITSYVNPSVMILNEMVPLVNSGNGLYEVSHHDADITYTEDVDAQNMFKQTEYRYAGSEPNNYVLFNNELWRVIGLVNTPEGQRVKIIRSESIGDYSWDTSASNVNSGYGVNEWSTSKMKELLNNGAYYNRSSGICYNGIKNATTPCDFSESGLTESAKEMIDTITWNTGSDSEIYTTNSKEFYNAERSKNTGKQCNGGTRCNDTITRTITWIGQIGLMYPSDYGYATSGGTSINRDDCLNNALFNWHLDEVSECKNNDWLFSNNRQWTITPNAYSSYADYAFFEFDGGRMSSGNIAYYNVKFRPSLYLKTKVKIESGDGTKNTPYILVF